MRPPLAHSVDLLAIFMDSKVGLYGETGRPGTQSTRFARGAGSTKATGQPHPVPRRVRPQLPSPGGGDTSQTGQGQ